MKKTRVYLYIGIALLVLFAAFTAITATLGVEPVGPDGSKVGLASVNAAVFEYLGTSDVWYTVTEFMGVIAILVALSFAVLGLLELIKRKSIKLVDRDILLLGALYAAVVLFYVLFEVLVINYRPVLVDGSLEPSYPSSHTMLSVCIVLSALVPLHRLLGERKRLILVIDVLAVIFCALMVVGRLLSGVHWLTDIVGAVLLSASLLIFYLFATEVTKK